MADKRQKTTLGSRFRFLVRTIGLTGVASVAFGGILAAATLPDVDFYSWAGWKTIPDVLRTAGNGDHGELAKVGAWMVACGTAAVLIALALEVLGAVVQGIGRRTAAGTAATTGVLAALVLLVSINIYSSTHYGRYDCTRDERFTLPPELVTELGKLRASVPTTIVVHQTHNFGPLMPTRDSFTKAAEAEVTAKVLDLVDQFREFGPQFKVVVLDKEAFEYRRELAALTKDAPELLAAIQATPENSIFFYGNKRVQRLSFSEFMQLDRTASDQLNEARANLVLILQGIDRFDRRILTVQERRPKVAVCVVHELLTTGADDPENRFTLAGLKAALTAQGFDVVDIVLKKGWSSARSISDLKPAADTREESKLERLEGELDDAAAEVASSRAEVQQFEAIRDVVNKLKGRSWEERKAFYLRITRVTITEDREPELLANLEKALKRARDELDEAAKKKQESEKKLAEALKDERPLQDRRMSDVTAKLTKQLADVDLLILPRLTVDDAMKGPGIEAALHALSKEQVKAIKEFMKRGKPVLACLGPITPQVAPQPGESPDEFDKRLATELGANSDGFERLLAERGIELGGSVILFDGETKALAGGDPFAGTRPTEPPPVVLAEPPPAEPAAGFKLTDQGFAALRIDGVPEPVLVKLDPLKNKWFSQERDFVEEIDRVLGKDELAKFQHRILKRADAALKPNPIAAAFRLSGRTAAPSPGSGRSAGLGAEQKFEIRLRAVRPVSLAPGWQAKQPFAAELAFTTGESWSELQPYPRLGRRPDGTRALVYAPKYEPTAIDDPRKGTRDEEKRGPFPIAIAIENKIPVAWMTEDATVADTFPLRSPYEREQAVAALFAPFDGTLAAGLTVAADKVERPTQRTVVFGSGNVFSGAELKPPQENLLLHTVNWLTNREDRLPKPATADREDRLPKPAAAETPEWQYPRVEMSGRDRILWRLGALFGMPLVVAYAGLLATMRRRMRERRAQDRFQDRRSVLPQPRPPAW